MQRYSDAICARADVWPDARRVSLWWDNCRGIMATRHACETYRALYGGNALLRGLDDLYALCARSHRPTTTRRWIGPLQLNLPLPADAVVFVKKSMFEKRERIVVTSAAAGRVMKIASADVWNPCESEYMAWRLASAAKIGRHVPQTIEKGGGSDDIHWLVSQLVPNSSPLYHYRPYFIQDRIWHRWLRQKVLPVLQRFYEQSGVEVHDGAEWVASSRDRVLRHAARDQLQPMVQLLEDSLAATGDVSVLFATGHGDLRPRHVHRHGDDWWLIDWGGSRPMPILWDLLCLFLERTQSRTFWGWLRGRDDMSALPACARRHLALFVGWLQSWRGVHLDAAALRFQVLATLLHNICVRPRLRELVAARTIEGLGLGKIR